MIDPALLEERRSDLIDRFSEAVGNRLDTEGRVGRGWATKSTSPAHYRGHNLVCNVVRACPDDIVLKGKPKRRKSKARQAKQIAAMMTFERMADRPLTPNATVTEVLENLLLRIATARDAGVISHVKARKMEDDARRRLRRLKRRRVN